MNQKKAKKLRKIARLVTENETVYNEGHSPQYHSMELNAMTRTFKIQKGEPRTLKLNTTRKVYKDMKRAFKSPDR